MIRMFFGPSELPLYGVYHPSQGKRTRRAVLLLGPWGWEALRAHRTLVLLAEKLSVAQFDVFRFDYSCTGDSAGRHDEAAPGAWVADAALALDELLDTAGVRKATLIGLRLGGLLAGELCSLRGRDIEQVVLWEAPHTGQEFMASASEMPRVEATAFPVPDGFRTRVQSMSLDESLANFRGRILNVSNRALSNTSADAHRRRQLSPGSEDQPCWSEDRDHGVGRVPVELLDRIIEEVL